MSNAKLPTNLRNQVEKEALRRYPWDFNDYGHETNLDKCDVFEQAEEYLYSLLPSGAIDNAGLRWVPCSEGMPTNHAIYFVKRSNGNKNTDFFCDPKTYYNGKQRVWLNYDDIVEWLDESSPIPTHKK